MTKVVLLIVCIVCAYGAVISISYTRYTGIWLPIAAYSDTQEWYSRVRNFTDTLILAFIPPTEKNIKYDTDVYVMQLNENRVNEENEVLRITGFDNIRDAASYYDIIEPEDINYQNPNYNLDQTQILIKILDEMLSNGLITDPVFHYQIDRLNEISSKYANLIENAPLNIENRYKQISEIARQEIENEYKYLYLILRGDEVIHTNIESSNPKGYIDNYDHVFCTILNSENKSIYAYGGLTQATYENVLQDIQYKKIDAAYTIYVAMRPGFYMQEEANYHARYNKYRISSVLSVLFLTAMGFCFVWLIKKAGVTDEGTVKISKLDAIYLDVGFFLMLICDLVLAILFFGLSDDYNIWQSVTKLDPLVIIGCLGIITAMICITLLWAMSLSRRIKLNQASHYTLIYKIYNQIKTQYDKSSIRAQGVVILILYVLTGLALASFAVFALLIRRDIALVLMAVVFVLVYIYCLLHFIFKKSAQVTEIEKGVDEIKSGNFDYLIPLTGSGSIECIAGGINNIAEGLSNAVSREVKSAKFKTELITNISHDLKTPLTSILTYIDLLKKEPNLPTEALTYIDILDKKSQRLKTLTDDLFDAAKASSGDIAVNTETLDLIQFIDQVFAEMQDAIAISGLTFIFNINYEHAYITADGKLLFRAMSNIIDNVLKYSVLESRVYISLDEFENEYRLTIKNISKEELNITEDELMERFVRGDSSRNTEGSGLGLSIAKDFMQLMDGKFIIEIDGDLFKAKLYIKKAPFNSTDFEGDSKDDTQ